MAVGGHRWAVTQEEAAATDQRTRGGSDGPIDAPLHTTNNSQRWREQATVFSSIFFFFFFLMRLRRPGPITGRRLIHCLKAEDFRPKLMLCSGHSCRFE